MSRILVDLLDHLHSCIKKRLGAGMCGSVIYIINANILTIFYDNEVNVDWSIIPIL